MISTTSSRPTPRMSEDCERVTVAESPLMPGILFLMRGQDTTTLRPSSLPNSASNRTSLPSLPSLSRLAASLRM